MAAIQPKSVGAVLLDRIKELLDTLAGEPKHAVLDQKYLALVEAYERMVGHPARATGTFTSEGVSLIKPEQEPADPNEPWEREPIKLVPATQIENAGEILQNEGNADHSGTA